MQLSPAEQSRKPSLRHSGGHALRLQRRDTKCFDSLHTREDVVFLELQRRFGAAYVGQVGSREVDFVVPTPDGLQYYQVAETVRDDATLGRELASLEAIRDNSSKHLLTLDDTAPVSHNGILQVNALEWLMEM